MSTVISPPVEAHLLTARPPQPKKEFRLIPRFENDPKIVQFAQTIPGKLALLAVFGLTLSVLDGYRWWLKLAFIAGMVFLPKFRRLLLTVATIAFTNFLWFRESNLTLMTVGGVQPTPVQEALWIVLPFVLLSAGLMWFARKYSKSFIGRRPLLTLLGIGAMLLVAAHYTPAQGFPRFLIWAFLLTFCSYFWFLAYAVEDSASPRGDNVVNQFGTFHSFWGSTGVPMPKGSAYLRKIEAKTPEELAVTMIKGVKLMLWCFFLSFVKTWYMEFAYHKMGIPHGPECVTAFLAGKPASIPMNWLSWPADFLTEMLTIAVWGHACIATCRMAGFRALRNTYAPLSSRTIAEYWNRYSFYFKELLVDMFFYPTFIRYFKSKPKARIFFATFVAAALGNTLYHFMWHLYIVSNIGLLRAVLSFRGYAMYSVLLALGISFSQIRSRKRHGQRGWFRERIAAPTCVLGFYCFVHIFEVTTTVNAVHYLAYILLGRHHWL